MGDRKPILCLDFDGVIHSYSSGWKGPRVIPDPPVGGALKFICMIVKSEKFNLQIYSSRSRYFGARRAMKRWIKDQLINISGVSTDRWEIPDPDGGDVPRWWWNWIAGYAFADPWDDEVDHAIKMLLKKIKFPTRKPPAFLTIDDRAWTFGGTFPDLPTIENFKPWNKQEV